MAYQIPSCSAAPAMRRPRGLTAQRRVGAAVPKSSDEYIVVKLYVVLTADVESVQHWRDLTPREAPSRVIPAHNDDR